MKISITLDNALAGYSRRLSTLADNYERAVREGLKEGGDKERTIIRRTLRPQMGTKAAGPITKGTSGNLAGGSEYVIRGVGKGLLIDEFPVKVKGKARHGNWRDQTRAASGRFGPLANPGIGLVTAAPWSISRTFARSFQLQDGAYVSTRPGSRSLQRLRGPSLAKEIVKDASAAAFESTAAPTVEAAIVKRLGRLIP